MSKIRRCDRCGGTPAYRALVRLMDGSRYISSVSGGDLCRKCASAPSSRAGVRFPGGA